MHFAFQNNYRNSFTSFNLFGWNKSSPENKPDRRSVKKFCA